MRILQITPGFGSIGGIESYVERLHPVLQARGHTTVIVTSELAPSVASRGDVCHIQGFNSPMGRGEHGAGERVVKLATEFQPDVVLSHSTKNGTLLRRLQARYPTVELVHTFLCAGSKLFRRGDALCTHPVTARCLVDWYARRCGCHRSPALAWQEHRRAVGYAAVLRRLEAVVIGSGFMRQYLLREGVPGDRLFLTDLSLGIASPRRVRPAAGGRVNVLFVGQLVYNKGVQYAIQALALLDDTYHLTVVGDGFYRAKLEALTARLGVRDRVTFTGYLRGAALQARYQEADIAIVPSVIPEPVGLVVPEARAQGLPVVTFRVGGLEEWPTRHEGIYLAEHAEVAALSRAMARAARREPPAVAEASQEFPQPLEEILERIVGQRAAGASDRPAQRLPQAVS